MILQANTQRHEMPLQSRNRTEALYPRIYLWNSNPWSLGRSCLTLRDKSGCVVLQQKE